MMNSPIPTVLPMSPKVLGCRVEHFDTTAGPETIIVRNVERPDLCPFCPRELCDARGGFCMVRVRGFVPDASCPTFSLHPAGDGRQGLAGLRVEGA